MIRLLHLTDPHLTRPEAKKFKQRRLKRFLGTQSWQRKRRHIHRSDTLQTVVDAVHSEAADQIVVTGDLVQVGLPEEIREAGVWLTQLGEPSQVRVIPGNHDAYAKDSQAAMIEQWGAYMGVQANFGGSLDEHYPVSWPLNKDGLRVNIIGLSSASPTPVLMASGRLGRDQRARYGRHVREPDVFECVLIHHPPLPRMSGWRKGLHDAKLFGRIVEERAPALVLHGHVHANSSHAQGSATRIFGTASASSAHTLHPASYRTFDISVLENQWMVSMSLKQLDLLSGQMQVIETQSWRLDLQH